MVERAQSLKDQVEVARLIHTLLDWNRSENTISLSSITETFTCFVVASSITLLPNKECDTEMEGC